MLVTLSPLSGVCAACKSIASFHADADAADARVKVVPFASRDIVPGRAPGVAVAVPVLQPAGGGVPVAAMPGGDRDCAGGPLAHGSVWNEVL